MKTRITWIGLLSLLFVLNGCVVGKITRGNGDLVTEEITITDYKQLSVTGGKIVVNYMQSEDAPFLEITTDENIFEKYEFVVENNQKLCIRPKAEFRRNHSFFPTEFTIKTNSHQLEKVEGAGGLLLNANSPLSSENLTVDVAGSATINLHERVTTNQLYASIAGSGTINAPELFCNTFRGDIAGSGRINLAGATEKAIFDIAGSGKVQAFDFHIDDLKSDIAGSGNLEVYVNNSITVDIAGSGKIRYKGNPADIKRSIAGAGSIKKAEE